MEVTCPTIHIHLLTCHTSWIRKWKTLPVNVLWYRGISLGPRRREDIRSWFGLPTYEDGERVSASSHCTKIRPDMSAAILLQWCHSEPESGDVVSRSCPHTYPLGGEQDSAVNLNLHHDRRANHRTTPPLSAAPSIQPRALMAPDGRSGS